MFLKFHKISFLLIALSVTVTLYAGNENNKGTAGAQELLLPAGARGLALGGSMIADIRGTEAIFWNPAGICRSPKSSEFMVSHFQYIAGIDLNAAAFTHSFNEYGTIGAAIKSVSIGTITETTVDQPDGTGETFSPAFQTMCLSYARSFTDRAMAGVNIKLVNEQILNESASGIAFDVGLQYEVRSLGLWFGFVLQNIGPKMQFTGSDLDHGTTQGNVSEPVSIILDQFDLPTSIEMAAAYNLLQTDNAQLLTFLQFQSNSHDNDELRVGIEFSYRNIIFLRGAYRSNLESTLDVNGNDRFLYGPSVGGGINYETDYGVTLQFDYAYRTVRYFNGNHLLTLKILW
jgi:hypothetical protein